MYYTINELTKDFSVFSFINSQFNSLPWQNERYKEIFNGMSTDELNVAYKIRSGKKITIAEDEAELKTLLNYSVKKNLLSWNRYAEACIAEYELLDNVTEHIENVTKNDVTTTTTSEQKQDIDTVTAGKVVDNGKDVLTLDTNDNNSINRAENETINRTENNTINRKGESSNNATRTDNLTNTLTKKGKEDTIHTPTNYTNKSEVQVAAFDASDYQKQSLTTNVESGTYKDEVSFNERIDESKDTGTQKNDVKTASEENETNATKEDATNKRTGEETNNLKRTGTETNKRDNAQTIDNDVVTSMTGNNNQSSKEDGSSTFIQDRHGNIGVTSSQQMLTQEYNLIRGIISKYIEFVFKSIDDDIVIPIWT